MDVKKGVTGRGFGFFEFTDSYGAECSIQESSSAEEPKIWLGASEIGIKYFIPYQGWKEPNLEELFGTNQIVANNRMHLTRDQVATLLPILEVFVKTGRLP